MSKHICKLCRSMIAMKNDRVYCPHALQNRYGRETTLANFLDSPGSAGVGCPDRCAFFQKSSIGKPKKVSQRILQECFHQVEAFQEHIESEVYKQLISNIQDLADRYNVKLVPEDRE